MTEMIMEFLNNAQSTVSPVIPVIGVFLIIRGLIRLAHGNEAAKGGSGWSWRRGGAARFQAWETTSGRRLSLARGDTPALVGILAWSPPCPRRRAGRGRPGASSGFDGRT